MEPLHYKNLLTKQCPRCDAPIELWDTHYRCTARNCDWGMVESRFKFLVGGMQPQKQPQRHE